MRLQLKPGLQRVSRGPGTVQIGLDTRHGVVVDGLVPADLILLEQLAAGVDEADLLSPAVPDPDPGRAVRNRRLIQLLADTGVLLRTRSGRAALALLGAARSRLTADAAIWSVVHPDAGDGWELLAERGHRTVEIRGGGRIGLAMATGLAATGVGSIRMQDGAVVDPSDVAPGAATPADLGARLPDVARRAIARATGQDRADPGAAPDLVVLIDRAVADAAGADRLLAEDVPHLSVVIRETSVLVGPLVLPGRGPCLRCLDLHRSERDRQWPMVLAQLLSARAARSTPREETATAQLSAALAVLQVIGQLDGLHSPAALGATLEVDLPDGLISRRAWPAHVSCGCHWPPSAAPEITRARTGGASSQR